MPGVTYGYSYMEYETQFILSSKPKQKKMKPVILEKVATASTRMLYFSETVPSPFQ